MSLFLLSKVIVDMFYRTNTILPAVCEQFKFSELPQSNSGQTPSNPISYIFILRIFHENLLSLKDDNKVQNEPILLRKRRKTGLFPGFLDFVSIKTVNHVS